MLKRFMPLLVAACVGAGAYHYFTNEVIQANDWQYYLETDLITQLKDRKDACKGLFHIPFTNIRVGTNETSCSMFAALSKDQQGVVQLAESPKPPTVLAALWAQSQHQPSSQLVAVGSKAEGGSDCDTGHVRVPSRFKSVVCDSARRHGIDAALLALQINAESGFNPRAVSRDKYGNIVAVGIAQITLSTAKAWGVNPWDPDQAINAMAYHVVRDGKTYQRQGHQRETALKLAHAKYNGGGEAVEYFKRHGLKFTYNPRAPRHSFARETAGYIWSIWSAYKRKV